MGDLQVKVVDYNCVRNVEIVIDVSACASSSGYLVSARELACASGYILGISCSKP